VVFGGNTGVTPVNDVWILNIEEIPYTWQNINCGSVKPSPRVYHSGALCKVGSASGMIVIFGGRL
jgi:protein phosphatase